MQATIAQLTREMEDARLNVHYFSREIEALHEKRRLSYQQYYQKKAELKALTSQNDAVQ